MTVMVNQDYPTTDALRAVNVSGDPVEGATVRIFTLVAFSANEVDDWVGMTTTDIDGYWVDPIALPDAGSWVVQFEKYSSYGPVHAEITT
jgi:hypothetical protein